MKNSNYAISVDNLKKTYKTYERGEGLLEATKSLFHRKQIKKVALKGISFKVKKGEILGLIGPNGAGKSTAIKALCGVLYPDEDSGEIRVLNYNPWEDREEYVQHLGAVFGQKSQLWWDLPPIDTFYLMKAIYEIPDNKFNQRLNEMVKLLKLEGVFKTPVRKLSFGERMKCELVASLLHGPKVVFLDEPTVGVDVVAKDKIRDFIRKVNKEDKTTFIITTHDMGDIERLCKRVIIINNGDIVHKGLLEDIKKKYIRNKIINIEFKEKVKLPKLVGCKILNKTAYSLKLEVSLKEQNLEKIINLFMNKFPIEDITISDPDIDEVIKEIYGESEDVL